MVDKTHVEHPSHYNSGKIEVIEYLRDALGEEGCYNFCIGNVIKYVMRARYKKDVKEDLAKAKWYLEYASKLNVGLVTAQNASSSAEDDTQNDKTGSTDPEDKISKYEDKISKYVEKDILKDWVNKYNKNAEDNESNYCANCPSRPDPLHPVIGDSPCSWCSHYPYRITWSDITCATTTADSAPKHKINNKGE